MIRGDLGAESELEGLEVDALEELHRTADRRGGLVVEGPDAPDDWGGSLPDSAHPSVLVVEDEPDMRRYLTEILEGDYRVMQARDGREGLRLALEREPDLECRT